MPVVLKFRGETFDPATLTVTELETVETIAGHGYGTVDPTARVGDWAALVTVFLLRTREADDVVALIEGSTLGDIAVEPVATG